jgi:flagella basal body P-ring formation protein FlgA
VLRTSDVVIERRPKAELGGGEMISRVAALGMQTRRPLRAGQALKALDLAKPDLVQRDQDVTIIFQTAGIYLTTRGKALDTGSEGDTVSVLNVQSKRTVSGRVVGRGQVAVEVATPRVGQQTAEANIGGPVTVANRLPNAATPKAE